MSQQTKKITREMTIEEILSGFPQKAQKLAQAITNTGLHCVGCQAAVWETLEAGMLGHGYTEAEIEKLLATLNDVVEEETNPDGIHLTKRAAEKFLEILKEEEKEGYALRFGDKAAGCSGFEYILGFSKEATAEDEIFTSHGVQLHVHKGAVSRLNGCEIDYVDGLNPGFKISNPNAKSACGCGKSQSY